MARIKHIALRADDPEKTATFYKEVFGLEEVGKARTGFYLSDGYLNIAILSKLETAHGETPRDVEGYTGIDHFGILVDDMDETCKKLENAGAEAAIPAVNTATQTNADGKSYFELKYKGPDGQIFDISAEGWVGGA